MEDKSKNAKKKTKKRRKFKDRYVLETFYENKNRNFDKILFK